MLQRLRASKLIHRSRSDNLRETKTVVYQCTYIFEAARKRLSKSEPLLAHNESWLSHNLCPAPAPKPPAPLPKDICEAGTFCNVACARKYANFDAAKGCANAAKGYCCEDTKPADYPFTPAA